MWQKLNSFWSKSCKNGKILVKLIILVVNKDFVRKNDPIIFTLPVPLICYYLPVREDWRVKLDVRENTIVD